MDKSKIEQILIGHQRFLATDGMVGSRANLYNTNLSNANLCNTDLSHSNLRYVNLRNANLRNVNLSNADLSHANLSHSNLSNTNLEGANIDFATFSLSCSTLKMKLDDRLLTQFLFHLLSNASQTPTSKVAKMLLTPELIRQANKFHRCVVDVDKIVILDDGDENS